MNSVRRNKREKDDISFIYTQITIQQNSQSFSFSNLYGCFFMMWIKSLLL